MSGKTDYVRPVSASRWNSRTVDYSKKESLYMRPLLHIVIHTLFLHWGFSSQQGSTSSSVQSIRFLVAVADSLIRRPRSPPSCARMLMQPKHEYLST
jgi:hypothetical protein